MSEKVTDEKAEEKKPELTADEKNQILREAVNFYMRTNYLQGDILKTCQDFIDDIDGKVREKVTTGEHHHSGGSHASTADYTPPKPKK